MKKTKKPKRYQKGGPVKSTQEPPKKKTISEEQDLYLKNYNELDRFLWDNYIMTDKIEPQTKQFFVQMQLDADKEIPSSIYEIYDEKNINAIRYLNNLYARVKPALTVENVDNLAEANWNPIKLASKVKSIRNMGVYKNDIDSLTKYLPNTAANYNMPVLKQFLKNSKDDPTYSMGGKIKYQQGGPVKSQNEINFKDIYMTGAGVRAMLAPNEAVPGTFGAKAQKLMDTPIDAPGRRIPPASDRRVQYLQNYVKNNFTRDDIARIYATPMTLAGVKEHLIDNPEFNITPKKVIGGIKAAGKALSLKREGYTFAEGGEIPEYSLGGIMKDVTIGAGTGAIGGGGVLSLPGAIIGGGVGLVKGLFTHFDEKKQEREEKAAAQNIINSGIATMQQSGSTNNYIPTFPMGGLIPYGLLNAELEKEEVTEGRNGTMRKFNLPPHKNATKESRVSLSPGTRVYSDRLINPATGNTFAKDADKYRSQKNKFSKILSNPKAAQIARKTAERSLENIQAKTDALFLEQEKIKSRKGLQNTGDEKTWGDFIKSAGTFLKSDTGRGLVSGMTELAPVAYNLFQGAGKNEVLKPQDFYNPMAYSGLDDMANRSFDIRPTLESNKAAQAVYNRNVQNLGGSAGNIRSNLMAGLNARMAGDAVGYSQKNNMDNAYLGERAGYKANIGQQMAATNLNISDINSRNAAARRAHLAAATGQLGQYSQMKTLGRNQREADNMRYNKWMQMMEQYYLGGRDRIRGTAPVSPTIWEPSEDLFKLKGNTLVDISGR